MSHLRDCVVEGCPRKEVFWDQNWVKLTGAPPLIPLCREHADEPKDGRTFALKDGVILFDGSTTLRFDTIEEIRARSPKEFRDFGYY
jgi:hypothetical protein